MIIDVVFRESGSTFDADFGEVHSASDGGFERGYEAGYAEGLSARTYEVWTITLTDGTTVDKEVPLL